MQVLFVVMAAALVQDPAKGNEEAKAVLKIYKEKRTVARTPEEISAAISLLKEAAPHAVIRTELIAVLNSPLPPNLRIPAADALGRYAKDRVACDALIRRAREDRGSETFHLRKRCLRAFAAIAPFGKATDLRALFVDLDVSVAREAVEAAKDVGSVRMLRPLVELLGELERIRDDEPLGCGPDQRADHDPKRQRKRELTDPVRKAILQISIRGGINLRAANYAEANRILEERMADLRKVRIEEDKRDRNP